MHLARLLNILFSIFQSPVLSCNAEGKIIHWRKETPHPIAMYAMETHGEVNFQYWDYVILFLYRIFQSLKNEYLYNRKQL